MAESEHSISRQTWKRLKKNKGALFGLFLIGLSVILAVFGYLIAPDHSPNADLQTVEIQAKKPGYTQKFLRIYDGQQNKKNGFSRLLYGQPLNYHLIPVQGNPRYNPTGDSLLIDRYVDEGISVRQAYSVIWLMNNSGKQPDDFFVTKKYWLGTDKFGRDILSRLTIGTCVSLSVGLISVLVSLFLGLFGLLFGVIAMVAVASAVPRTVVVDWNKREVEVRRLMKRRRIAFEAIQSVEMKALHHLSSGRNPRHNYWCEVGLHVRDDKTGNGTYEALVESERLQDDPDSPPRVTLPLATELANALGVPRRISDYS